MRPEADGLTELQTLLARLEQSGLAGQRPEVAALVARSRILLGPAAAPRTAGPPLSDGSDASADLPTRPVPQPPRRTATRPAAKLRLLLLAVLDTTVALVGAAALLGLARGTAAAGLAGPVLGAALAWGLWRWGGAPVAVAEALARLSYALRWGWLWLAEAFSEAALQRLQVLLDAREVMRGWRAWRRALPRRPRLADVEAFLAEAHGAQAVGRFRFALAVRGEARRGWTLRGGFARQPAPLREAEALRWSRLILLFEAIAREGALWPPATPPAYRPPDPPPPPPPLAEDPEHTRRMQRRIELREAIRRKREEIRQTKEWKMKTPAEVAQQEAHLARLRDEVAALEAELRASA